jgi:serine/threonine-protein phosphatase 5
VSERLIGQPLLAGNHECEFCTEVYGYKRELLVKYGKPPGTALYRQFMQLGAALPLAALVAGLYKSSKE